MFREIDRRSMLYLISVIFHNLSNTALFKKNNFERKRVLGRATIKTVGMVFCCNVRTK